MNSKFLAAAGGALLFSTAALAQQSQQGDVFSRLLGAVFGTNQQASEQVLEQDWDQGRRPFDQRRPQLDARIDAAVQDGSIGRREADQMRREYDDIVRLEAQYAADGNVSREQRGDLRARYRALVQRVDGRGDGQGVGQGDGQGDNRGDYRDGQGGPVMASRDSDFERRLASAINGGRVGPAEAARLRNDWRELGRLEGEYQRGGIDAREAADLRLRNEAIDRRLGGAGSSIGTDRDPARWTRLEQRLAVAERYGRINRALAAQVRVQLGDLGRLDAAYRAAGYNADERSYLARRYRDIQVVLGR